MASSQSKQEKCLEEYRLYNTDMKNYTFTRAGLIWPELVSENQHSINQNQHSITPNKKIMSRIQ